MKTLILAGGYGTRLSEETDLKPKPMVEIGGYPILWHIMKIYAYYGHRDFVVLLGYKGYMIKEYFVNYLLHQSDLEVNLSDNEIRVLNRRAEPWTVSLIDTGLDTMTGGRIARARELVGEERFMLTYGDGVGSVDIGRLVDFHENHKGAITMTTVRPEGRFGGVEFDAQGTRVDRFIEKPPGDGAWINAGFFVCEPRVFDYLGDDDSMPFERSPLENMASDGELYAFKHDGFWKPMDTLRDKRQLDDLWKKGNAPWKLW